MNISSISLRVSNLSLVILPIHLIPRPGPGKGCLEMKSLFNPNSAPIFLTSSLKSSLNGSIILKLMSLGSPPTL